MNPLCGVCFGISRERRLHDIFPIVEIEGLGVGCCVSQRARVGDATWWGGGGECDVKGATSISQAPHYLSPLCLFVVFLILCLRCTLSHHNVCVLGFINLPAVRTDSRTEAEFTSKTAIGVATKLRNQC